MNRRPVTTSFWKLEKLMCHSIVICGVNEAFCSFNNNFDILHLAISFLNYFNDKTFLMTEIVDPVLLFCIVTQSNYSIFFTIALKISLVFHSVVICNFYLTIFLSFYICQFHCLIILITKQF